MMPMPLPRLVPAPQEWKLAAHFSPFQAMTRLAEMQVGMTLVAAELAIALSPLGLVGAVGRRAARPATAVTEGSVVPMVRPRLAAVPATTAPKPVPRPVRPAAKKTARPTAAQTASKAARPAPKPVPVSSFAAPAAPVAPKAKPAPTAEAKARPAKVVKAAPVVKEAVAGRTAPPPATPAAAKPPADPARPRARRTPATPSQPFKVEE